MKIQSEIVFSPSCFKIGRMSIHSNFLTNEAKYNRHSVKLLSYGLERWRQQMSLKRLLNFNPLSIDDINLCMKNNNLYI